jgi:threonine aldolase
VIDLRSDTLTIPSRRMREAALDAPLGDDLYGEDPTVIELEKRTAALLGHEAGLFVASGTLSNLLGVYTLVTPGDEVLCDEMAHIVRAESGSHAGLHGVTTRTWSSGGTGVGDVSTIEALISPRGGFLTPTGAIEIENTHNFGGGTVQPLEHVREVSDLAKKHSLGFHIDGARLWNAHIATGIPMADYGRLADSVSVCYSKGLGAPVGSVLVSNADAIARARARRRALGAAWRQAGVLAAMALYALDNNVARLAEDHAAAAEIARLIVDSAPQAIKAAPQTNIVVIDTGARPAAEVIAAAKERSLAISQVGPRTVRAVTNLNVTYDDCVIAGRTLGAILA